MDGTDIILSDLTANALAAGEALALTQELLIPVGTVAGNYFILFEADCDQLIAESDETNNLSTTTASLTLSNIGDGDAATSKVCFYLSTDNQLDGTDIILSDLTANALAAGEALALTQELLIPVGTVAGNYFILFEADCDQLIAESDETNNLSIVPISIDQPLSDLTIVDPALSVTQLLPGETTTASLTLSNIGDGDAATSKVCFYLSTDNQLDGTDIILSDLTTNALAAGEALALTQELLIPAGTVAGNYFILFEADCDQLIAESDETNNLSIVPISIDQPLSDLTIVDPALSVTQLLPGETTTASLTLSNIGDGDAATSKVCFYLSTDNQLDGTDIILSDLTANALAAGEALALTQELLIPVGTVAGNYFILFEADCDQLIAESDETNNLSIVPISIDQPLSDLTIVDPALSVTQLLPGETTTASLTLSNIGDGDAATSKVCFYLSTDNQLDGTDIILSDLTANALAAGEALALTQELLIPVGTVAGNYFILFEADCDQLIAESDETNNLSIVPISIDQPLSDLTISNPVLTPNSVFPGELLSTRFSLNNLGTGDAMASNICIFFSNDNVLDETDVLLEEMDVPSILSSTSEELTQEITVPEGIAAGTYFIIFEADCDQLVQESDEDNNSISIALSVGQPQADLSIDSEAIDPSTLEQGSSTTASFTLRNTGNGNAAASTICFYLSADNELDISDLLLQEINAEALVSGSSSELLESITIPASIVAGDYFLMIEADCREAIPESDETNNIVALSISITERPRPDMIVQEASIDPASVLAGESPTANFTIANQGSGNAEASEVCLFLSSDNTFESNTDIEVGSFAMDALNSNSSQSLTLNMRIPVNIDPGAYFILLLADCKEAVDELDETNNLFVLEITIASPLPDVTIGSVEFTPIALMAGEEGLVSAEVRNVGQAIASLSNTCFFLSSNSTFEVGEDVLLASVETSTIEANLSQSIQRSVIIPANTLAGDYFIIAFADCLNELVESDEENNRSITPITIEAAPPSDPDLTVINPAVVSLPVQIGAENLATFDVQNISTQFDADASITCIFLSEDDDFDAIVDTQLGEVATIPLDPEEVTSLSIPFTVQDNIEIGDYQLLFIADCIDGVREENEINNVVSIPVMIVDSTIDERPDLTIQAPRGLPNNPQPQQDVNVTVSISNESEGASLPFELCVIFSKDDQRDNLDRELINALVGPISANSDTTINLSFTLPSDMDSGDFLIFVADCDNVNQDSDLSNNSLPAVLEVLPSSRCEGLNFTNIVTPNGDGVNDDWIITGLPEDHSLRIVDRWGNEILSTGNYQQNWPGSVGAFSNTPSGSYFYMLSSESLESSTPCKGAIIVIR